MTPSGPFLSNPYHTSNRRVLLLAQIALPKGIKLLVPVFEAMFFEPQFGLSGPKDWEAGALKARQIIWPLGDIRNNLRVVIEVR